MRQASALGRPQAWLLPLERSARTLVSYWQLARSCLHTPKKRLLQALGGKCRLARAVHKSTSACSSSAEHEIRQ